MNTICCVLEWENAEGLEREEARHFLGALIQKLEAFGESQNRKMELMIIFDEDVPKDDIEEDLTLSEAGPADRVEIKLLCAPGTGYYDKKGLAPYFTEADLLIYADSDCAYVPDWLEQHITAIEVEGASVSSGYTQALAPANLIEEVCTYAWFFPSEDPRDRLHRKAKNRFFANNFAAKRSVLLDVPLPRLDASRGHGGVWTKRLAERQVKLVKLPGARADHKQYDTVGDMFKRALILGRDKDFGLFINGAGRGKRIWRSFVALFETTVKFLQRFFTVAMRNTPVWHWPIVLVLGLAFQWITTARQMLAAIAQTYAEEQKGYSDLAERVTTSIWTATPNPA